MTAADSLGLGAWWMDRISDFNLFGLSFAHP
jgi:hypothetical protein